MGPRVVFGFGPVAGVRSPDELSGEIVRAEVAPLCAAGWATPFGRDLGGSQEVLFDLASLTKPMTAVAFVRAGIDPRTPLGELLPEVRATASERVPVELLLAHRGGLEAHRTLYGPLLRGEPVDVVAAYREASDARRPDAQGEPGRDGFEPLYSDLGYVLAGAALARAVGVRDAGEAIGQLVLEPLGIADCAGTVRELEARGVTGPFAATETVAWRGGPVLGAVHDENAWALTGRGGSGHAGIFGTLDAVLTLGLALLRDVRRPDRREGADANTEVRRPDRREGADANTEVRRPERTEGADANTEVRLDPWPGREFHEARAGRPEAEHAGLSWLVRERPGGSLRAGFDGKSPAPAASSAGERMGPRTFGHLGFTGTSFWIDPDAGIVVALLTNRVCPSRDNVMIRAARPWAHDHLFAMALARSST
jgi:CubicO group peptidase (beta-lactamase class C family)